jgi:hypothetical protein
MDFNCQKRFCHIPILAITDDTFYMPKKSKFYQLPKNWKVVILNIWIYIDKKSWIHFFKKIPASPITIKQN